MTTTRLFRRLAPLVIVTILLGCDNVEWGGAELGVVPPPPRATDGTEEDDDPRVERVPDGPILYRVSAIGGQGTLVPLGEITADALEPLRAAADWDEYGTRLISRHLREGAEFSLFRHGARVGTLVLRTATVPDEAVCPRLPRAGGVLELTAGTEPDGEFLALAKGQVREPPVTDPPDAQPTRVMERLAPILAERMLRARAAPLPGDWQRAMAQVHPFPVAGRADRAFASSFLVGDSLAPGSREEGHSLFFIAEPAPQIGFDTVFVRYANYARDGRAARRVVDALDWNRDGEVGLLLEVYGNDESWFEAVSRVNGEWRLVFEDRCPPRAAAPAPAVDAGPAEGPAT